MRRDPARPGPGNWFVTPTTRSTEQVELNETHHEHTIASMFCGVKDHTKANPLSLLQIVTKIMKIAIMNWYY